MGVLDGRVAVVTAASRGIGAAVAERLAAEGARVVVAARTVDAAHSKLEGTIGETVARVEAAGGTAFAQPTDLSREHDRQALVQAAERRHGPVDILVDNFGGTVYGMCHAALERFTTGLAAELTGRIAYSQDLLDELRHV
ncbi:SDR family NAD(P)-dependent oxidoreductase [Nonomuraea sp. FMUSA5-5]|uniref:SDR family NAD(P)-dependent oxidoreductase n=1 Tax=Nonomuraea composti TaxID=2720023 RepID=A0ABX1BKD0_9ACTN|nr:SDR family NAD(P)-dependent oxidoreductase [Nonomuraea sp. FMUSA5-5]NJP96845.1 SDR family NAD(P)-dependent oxidoreductase [Nonomuraea sp. FMUSA5-5]